MANMLARVLLPLSLLAQTVAAQADEVKFYAGGGFRTVMTELAPMFQKATGHTVAPTWDSAGGLERRVNAGESFDVLFIGPDIVDRLAQQGKIVAGTRHDVARAGLGVAVRKGAPKPDVSTVAALSETLSSAKSIAYVGEGMSGVYFVGMLDRLKLADRIKPKLKPLGVADVTKAVASGEADLVVYLMPALLADRGLDLAGPLPADVQNYVVLATGLSAAAPQPEAAKALIAFLQSDAVSKAMRASGW
jgi:molybdate transport system substrate-binding protein